MSRHGGARGTSRDRLEHAGHAVGLHAVDAPADDPIGVARDDAALFKGRTWWTRSELKKSLRRRHHRRRRARHGDRLLPRQAPRHHERRRAREELHRRGRHRPQHDDHPLELPHARGHPLLRALDASCTRGLSQELDYQHDAVDARALHARPHRLVGARAARARRDEPAARRQLAADRPRGDRRAVPRAEHVDRRRLPDPGRALPPARRHAAARRRRLGLRHGRLPPGRAPAPGRRGDRHPQGRERPLHRRRHHAGPHRRGRRHLGRRRAGRRRSATWRASARRSPTTRCRRS